MILLCVIPNIVRRPHLAFENGVDIHRVDRTGFSCFCCSFPGRHETRIRSPVAVECMVHDSRACLLVLSSCFALGMYSLLWNSYSGTKWFQGRENVFRT